MDTRASYTIVGIFVIILALAGITISVWLSMGVTGKRYDKYEIFLNESISGLTEKATVKYNGVEVGFVDSINLDRVDPQKVVILLSIEQGIPISVDTYAELDSQGFTGIAYIELSGGKENSLPLKAKPGQKYPVIQSKPSLLFRLDEAMGHLTENIDYLSQGLSSAASKENTQALHEVLQNLERVTSNLAANSEKIDSLIQNSNETFINTAQASQQLPGLMTNLNQGINEFKEMMDDLSEASQQAKITMNNASAAMENVNDQLLPKAADVLDNMESVLHNAKDLSQQLDANPSVILRGRRAPPRGPGE